MQIQLKRLFNWCPQPPPSNHRLLLQHSKPIMSVLTIGLLAAMILAMSSLAFSYTLSSAAVMPNTPTSTPATSAGPAPSATPQAIQPHAKLPSPIQTATPTPTATYSSGAPYNPGIIGPPGVNVSSPPIDPLYDDIVICQTSLVFGSDGNPHIAYREGTTLMYALWDGTAWCKQAIDSIGELPASLALDGADFPHISYYDDINCDLKYAHWTGAGWSIETVDSVGNVGRYSSIAVDGEGNPHISYYGNQYLLYASWTGTNWTKQFVDSAETVSQLSSLVLDQNGNPHISFSTAMGNLRYVNWNGNTWTIQAVDPKATVFSMSLTLDSNGNPHIGYLDTTKFQVKYAVFDGTAWMIQTVDSNGNTGGSCRLALDSSGTPHLSYYFSKNPLGVKHADLKYAGWNGTHFDVMPIDSSAVIGASIAVDTNGSPHISYCNSLGALMYASWNGTKWNVTPVTT